MLFKLQGVRAIIVCMNIPKLYSPKRTERLINKHADWIGEAASRFHVPAAALKAVLYREMTGIDLLDPLADLAAMTGFKGKHDSSVGYGQIFGYVGINAVNFAVSQGIAGYADFGLPEGRVLDPGRREDVKLLWRVLLRDRKKNIGIMALNLRLCAQEMTGTADFDRLTAEELKLTFTRYNADVKKVTAYGEEVFGLFLRFGGQCAVRENSS